MLIVSAAGFRTVVGVVAIFFLLNVIHANALPQQYLPDIPGFVPVYMRHGDQPLEEINPALAIAFHESTGFLESFRSSRSDDIELENLNKESTDEK